MAQLGRIGLLGCQLVRATATASPVLNQTVARRMTPTVYTTQKRFRFNPKNPGIAFPREGNEETDEEFDQRYVNYFNREDIDGWELRKGINDLNGYDLIPEPKIMIAVLKACRRINDHSLAVRYLEAVERKACHKKEIVDYLYEEIRPTLNDLGISTPRELGYHEPELAMGDPDRSSLLEREP